MSAFTLVVVAILLLPHVCLSFGSLRNSVRTNQYVKFPMRDKVFVWHLWEHQVLPSSFTIFFGKQKQIMVRPTTTVDLVEQSPYYVRGMCFISIILCLFSVPLCPKKENTPFTPILSLHTQWDVALLTGRPSCSYHLNVVFQFYFPYCHSLSYLHDLARMWPSRQQCSAMHCTIFNAVTSKKFLKQKVCAVVLSSYSFAWVQKRRQILL